MTQKWIQSFNYCEPWPNLRIATFYAIHFLYPLSIRASKVNASNYIQIQWNTLPETNIAPENRPS